MDPQYPGGRINKRMIYPMIAGLIALMALFVGSLFYATNLPPSPAVQIKPPHIATVIIPKGSTQPGQPSLIPQNVTLIVGFNNTVVWRNQDVVPVTIVSDSNYIDPVTGNFSSFAQIPGGYILPGKTFNFTFTQPGRYGYNSIPHPFVHGIVIVGAGS